MSNTPSDEELRQLAEECGIGWGAGLGGMDDFLRAFARAVLVKWGTPQPVVREPLTDEQINALIAAKHFREGYELTASDKVCINWYRLGLRDGERAHGITQKGGSNADTATN